MKSLILNERSLQAGAAFAALKKAPLSVKLIRIATMLLGVGTTGFGLIALKPGISGTENSAVLVPIGIGLGLVVFGLNIRNGWEKAAFWFALAIIGQTLSMQMINAGYQLRYQHYKPLSELLRFPTVMYTAGLGLQFIVVGYGIRRLLPRILSWFRSNVRLWQVLVLALCFFVPAATVSPDVSFYVGELILAGLVQFLALATIVLFAHAIPDESLERLRSFRGRQLTDKNVRVGVATAAVFVVILAVVLNLYSYERHPHVPDEVAYLMQAQFFAAGVITMPAPPVPEAFEVYLAKVDGGHWYPVTPPGWALVLSIGTLFGAPFLVNPVLAGLNVLLTYRLLKRLYPISTAGMAALLLAASPWFVFLGMSFMTHMLTLTAVLVAAMGVEKAREDQNWQWGLVSGAAIGFLSLIRPLEALAVAGLLGLWMVGVGGKRMTFPSITATIVGTLLIGSIGLGFNARLTGDPLQFPINRYTDEVFGVNSNAYGFGADRGMGWALDPYPGHGPVDALVNTNLNVSALNTELLGWPIGSFLLIGALLCFGKLRRADYLMLALIAVIYGLHFFYYFSGGPDFGARYWFLMIVPLIVLSVRGLQSLAKMLNERTPQSAIRLYSAVGALMILTIGVFIPWRAVDKYHNFRGMKPDVRELAQEFQFGRSLVLVQGNQHPDYDSTFIYNSLDLDGDGPVFAWDKDSETREKLLRFYADRPVWIVRSPSLTGRSYEVAAGPVSAESALAARHE